MTPTATASTGADVTATPTPTSTTDEPKKSWYLYFRWAHTRLSAYIENSMNKLYAHGSSSERPKNELAQVAHDLACQAHDLLNLIDTGDSSRLIKLNTRESRNAALQLLMALHKNPDLIRETNLHEYADYCRKAELRRPPNHKRQLLSSMLKLTLSPLRCCRIGWICHKSC